MRYAKRRPEHPQRSANRQTDPEADRKVWPLDARIPATLPHGVLECGPEEQRPNVADDVWVSSITLSFKKQGTFWGSKSAVFEHQWPAGPALAAGPMCDIASAAAANPLDQRPGTIQFPPLQQGHIAGKLAPFAGGSHRRRRPFITLDLGGGIQESGEVSNRSQKEQLP